MTAVEPAAGQGAPVVLATEGLGKRFGDRWALRDLDLELRAGEVLGLIGPGGHGKTVLLKLLAGLIRPDTGRVLAGGRDLRSLTPSRMAGHRDRIGFLFQNDALFDFMTVFDNVAFPLRQRAQGGAAHGEDEIAERVRGILEQVGLGHALDLFPRQLSGGMRKRVGLARAAVTLAPLTFYDDPSAGLDPVTSSKIFRLIDVLHRQVEGSAVIVVSHDIDRIRAICERYVMIIEGRKVFEGPESAIAGAPPVVSEFFFGAISTAAIPAASP